MRPRAEAAAGSAILSAARRYAAAGLSVVPVRCDGSKAPAIVWRRYQQRRAGSSLSAWFAAGRHGIAVVCGPVSGGLEVIDFEEAELFDRWRERLERDAPGLLDRLPVVATPRPGRHVYLRCDEPGPSRKLALGADGKTRIESKGEGGYVIAPGSPPACHPSGRPYAHLAGPPPTDTPRITAAERDRLFDAARSFDAGPRPATDRPRPADLGTRPAGPAEAPTTPAGLEVLARARAYLVECDPAVSGQYGHNQTFKVACKLVKGFGLSPEQALELLLTDYNPRCVPPWTVKELRHKATDAACQPGETGYMLTPPRSPDAPSLNGQIAAAAAAPGRPRPPRLTWGGVPISQLTRSPTHGTWVWEGMFAPGKITLLSGEAKCGKSTLLALLYAQMASGGLLCGSAVTKGKVIVISEEPPDIWIGRRERFGLADNVTVFPVPFDTKPSPSQWQDLIELTVAQLAEQPAALVVFDTLSHLWWLLDENDNARVAQALMPLRRLSGAGPAVAIVHHFGAERNGPRGSTELRAFPDLQADMHLSQPADFGNPRRTLKVRGRLLPAPRQLVIELNEAGDDYTVIEGAFACGPPDLWTVLQRLVPDQPPGLSAEDFHKRWPTERVPKVNSIRDALTRNWEKAGWRREGTGGRGKAFRFWHPAPAAEHSSA